MTGKLQMKPSLLERAAEVYDFNSGLRLAPLAQPAAELAAEPMPQPRVRPEPPRPIERPRVAAPRPVVVPPPPASEPPASATSVPPRPPRAHVELDRVILQQNGLLLPDATNSALAEEMRLVKRRLLARADTQTSRADARSRLILVTSGQPGEGKTFIAANLALSIAGEQDRAVLLIDGDTAKADLPPRLGMDPAPGLVDALADRSLDPEALVIDTDIPGLSILTAGRQERNVPELLASSRTKEVLDRLLDADPSRIIVMDSPPALTLSTAGALAEQVGQALVVVRADRTSEADLKETLALLSGCDQLALILNAAAFKIGGRRYGRYEEYR